MKTSLLLGILFARDGPTFTKKLLKLFAIFLLPVIVAPLLLNSAGYVIPLVFLLITLFSIFHVSLMFPLFFLKVLCSVVFHNTLVCLSVCSYIFLICLH